MLCFSFTWGRGPGQEEDVKEWAPGTKDGAQGRSGTWSLGLGPQ